MTEIRRATIKSYDPATHKADIQIAGSLAVYLEDVRVATDIPAADVQAGRQCIVLFRDPSNQDEAVVATIQGALPSGGGAALDGAPPANEDSSSAGSASTAQRSDHFHECFVRAIASFPGFTPFRLPGWYSAGFQYSQPGYGHLIYIPIYVPVTTTFTGIGIYVQTALGTLARLGIYNYAAGQPTSLVLDAGTVSTASTGDKIITISQQLTAGYYWTAIICDRVPTLGGPSTSLAISPATTGFSGGGVLGGNNVLTAAAGRIGDVAGGLADPAPTPTMYYPSSHAFVALRA